MRNMFIGIVTFTSLTIATVATADEKAPTAIEISVNAAVKTPSKLIEGTFLDSDFPEVASEINASGIVIAEFVVEKDGLVRTCGIIGSAGNDALDSRTCEVLKARYRYKPALDKNRKPVPEFRTLRVKWTQPDTPTPTPYDYYFSYTIGKDGKTRDCVVEGSIPVKYDKKNQDSDCNGLPVYAPAFDSRGQPTEVRVRWRYAVETSPIVPAKSK